MKKTKFLIGLLIIFSCFIIGNSKIKAEGNYKLSFRSDTVNYGDKIYVDMEGFSEEEKNYPIIAFFAPQTDYSEGGGMISITLQDVNSDNPYFETSSYMIMGHSYVMHTIHVGNKTLTITPGMGGDGLFTSDCHDIKVEAPLSIDRIEVSNNTKEVTKSGKVRITMNTSNADKYDLNNIGMGIRNINVPSVTAYGYLNRISGNEYQYDLTRAQGKSDLINGEYIISVLYIFPKDGGQAIEFVADNYYGDQNIIITSTFNIVDGQKSSEKKKETKKTDEFLKKIEIKKKNIKINEKVEVNISAQKKISMASLTFINDTERINVEVKDLNKKPYFIIPFTSKAGTYKLYSATFKDIDGKEHKYRNDETIQDIYQFNFDFTIQIDDNFVDGDVINLDNNKITSEIIEKLKKLDSKINIDINADENPIITKELFDTIKDTKKKLRIRFDDVEWIFNGNDIKESKAIDSSVNYYRVSKDTKIKSKVKKGFVLEFNNTGKLPGNALIKVYNNDDFNDLFDNDKINIYYYNNKKDLFEIVDLNSKFNKKGFYEFEIEHTSKYVLTTEIIDNEYLVSNSNEESNKLFGINPIILISASAALLVIIVTVVILIIRNKKKKKQKNTINNTVENNDISNDINNDLNDQNINNE